MQALDGVGYEGWASAEVAGGDRKRLETVAAQMDALFAR
jgi:L-ribulose-5-phosphate 3-epimerase